MESKKLEVNLTDKEVKEFNELCAIQHIHPAQKIGELIHGFVLSEGVKAKPKGHNDERTRTHDGGARRD